MLGLQDLRDFRIFDGIVPLELHRAKLRLPALIDRENDDGGPVLVIDVDRVGHLDLVEALARI